MDSLIIDRGQWLTGSVLNYLNSCLRDKDTGLMCCLGVYGKACGMPEVELNKKVALRGSGRPDEAAWLSKTLDNKDTKRFADSDYSSDVQGALMDVNDNNHIHPSRREAAIAYLFKKYGFIDVTFVGKYAEATKKARTYGKKDAD